MLTANGIVNCPDKLRTPIAIIVLHVHCGNRGAGLLGNLLVEFADCFDGRGELGEALKLAEDVEGGIERIYSFVVKREVGNAEIGVGIFVIFVIAHHDWGVVTEAIASHEGKIILECAPAHGVASSFEFSEGIGAGVDEVVDGPATIMVPKATVDGRNPYQCSAIEWHNKKFYPKLRYLTFYLLATLRS